VSNATKLTKLSDKADAKGLMPGVLCGTVCDRDLADKLRGTYEGAAGPLETASLEGYQSL